MFKNEADLAEALVATCGSTHVGRVSVGLLFGDQSLRTSVLCGPFGARVDGARAAMCFGCVAKVFTATLVAQAVCDGQIDLDGSVMRQLSGLSPAGRALLHQVSVRQLLDHTHGLDGSGVSDINTLPCGRIDLTHLLGELSSAAPLAAPGEVFNYSGVGPWIAAALLEHRFAVSYERILHDVLLKPLKIECWASTTCVAHSKSRNRCCPATGGQMTTWLDGMLAFARYHLDGDRRHGKEAVTLMRGTPALLPGRAVEVGQCLGWNYFGAGWYGHRSDVQGCSSVIRINPERRIALLTACESRAAFEIQSQMFRDLLPGQRDSPLERQRPGLEQEFEDLESYVGTYHSYALSISVTQATESTLLMTCQRREGGAQLPGARIELRRAQGAIFTAGLPSHGEVSWVEFVRPDAKGYRYLWNGRAVWRRVSPNP